MKILITGANGLLGSKLFEYLVKQGEIVTKYDRREFSWIDNNKNIKKFEEFDYIIHAAAKTDVEECEKDQKSCYLNNTLLTDRISYAASQAGCRFVYISSTGIYGTAKKDDPYHEYDNVYPTTHHHNSKWLGEKAVMNYNKDSLIIRTGWLYGGESDANKNFVESRIKEALNSNTKIIYSNIDQIGVPTYTTDLVKKIYELINNKENGVFNIVNKGKCSRYEFVLNIIKIAGLQVEVIPVNSNYFNRRAQVSNNESAVSLKLHQLGYKELPDWQESLNGYIENDLKRWINKNSNL
jgi:dTDP-4-dehydrorhamnose reductase